jgi:hypothetical protein
MTAQGETDEASGEGFSAVDDAASLTAPEANREHATPGEGWRMVIRESGEILDADVGCLAALNADRLAALVGHNVSEFLRVDEEPSASTGDEQPA